MSGVVTQADHDAIARIIDPLAFEKLRVKLPSWAERQKERDRGEALAKADAILAHREAHTAGLVDVLAGLVRVNGPGHSSKDKHAAFLAARAALTEHGK